MSIIDASTMREIKSTVDLLGMKIIDLERNVNSLMDRADVSAKMDLVNEHVEPDTEANTAFSNSLQRHVSQDQLYLNGMVVPTVVNPPLAEFADGAGNYLVCVRHNVSGGVPTVKWSTMQTAIASAPDIYVKANPEDTVPGVLYGADNSEFNKLAQGAGITLTETAGVGGDTHVEISVTPGGHNQSISTITVGTGGDDHDFLYVDGSNIAHVPFFSALTHTNAGNANWDLIYWKSDTSEWTKGAAKGVIYGELDELGYVTSSDYYVVNSTGDKYQMVVEHGLIKQFVAA